MDHVSGKRLPARLLSGRLDSQQRARALVPHTRDLGNTLVAENEWVLCTTKADGSSINWGKKMMLFPEKKHQVLCSWEFGEDGGKNRNLWRKL